MFTKKGVRLLVFACLLALLMTACFTAKVSTGKGQICPAWANYPPGSKCNIKIWKDTIAEPETVDFGTYEKIRITFVASEVLIDDGVNIVVHRDNGELVDYEHVRISPGSYILEREKLDAPASFKITNHSSSSNYLSLGGEFVELMKE